MLTKSVAVRYAKDNIRCNSIHPSTVETPFVQTLLQGSGAQGGETGRDSAGKAGEHGRRCERAGLSGERRGIVHQRGCACDRRRPDGLLALPRCWVAAEQARLVAICAPGTALGRPARVHYTGRGKGFPITSISLSSVLESTDANLLGVAYACARSCGSAAAYAGDAAHRALGESFRPDPERRHGLGAASVCSIPNS